MRHLMCSFLAFHWAILFALLAFVCIGGATGLEAVLAAFGTGHDAIGSLRLDGVLVTAPLASAFLIVAALFSWALIETFLGKDTDSAEAIFKVGFVAAGCVFLLMLIYGIVQDIGGLFLSSAVHLAAIAVSYLVVLGERSTVIEPKVLAAPAVRTTAFTMARSAAHASLLSRISGRPDSGGQS